MTYNTNTLAKIGRNVIKNHPEIANNIISEWKPASNYDLNKIPDYFISFCMAYNLNLNENIGPVFKSSKLDQRRLFIAAIVKIYHPGTRALAKWISSTIKQDYSDTVKMVKEVEFRYRMMKEFSVQVDEVVKKITNAN